MGYNVNLGCWNNVFAVPKKVSEKLKLASAYQLKVILYVLSHGGEKLSDDIIAQKLNMHPSDVKDSLLYWVENDVITISQDEILPVESKENTDQNIGEATAVNDNTNNNVNADLNSDVKAPNLNESNKTENQKQFVVSRTQRPDSFYVAKLLSENKEMSFLMDEVQSILGKTLSSGDTAKIVMLYDTAGLPADVIIMLIQYCVSIGKPNMLAIEKMGVQWANEGINTLAFAEEKIKLLYQSDKAWGRVCAVFGIKTIGSPTRKQLDFANMWLNEWKFSDDMIREAYERCVDAKGEYKLAYINAILKKWHQGGIFSLEALESSEKRRNTGSDKTSDKKTSHKASYDLDEIENKSMFDD